MRITKIVFIIIFEVQNEHYIISKIKGRFIGKSWTIAAKAAARCFY